ncbi:c-di-GMP-binding flagellar brake protein YcgR, contains PilZNR and PilZ domains [Ectothiorhodospira magna]|uniref:C-di-GMP-binding flagellar brake protein YcgR, contains PilZNR and PilZ domains n=1 Tax=Ectothiorhodospira magna TaxID=867345 RepID=A0A1H9DDE5_9GAMM|nr:flagellar brake protein [Ectothiorhodospira magna]SEQ11592.1 c-di-GMP-binding flagellar brake protein YcgR, contains PilZNR and PilZ domains [Ectothiorhodospira magna]
MNQTLRSSPASTMHVADQNRVHGLFRQLEAQQALINVRFDGDHEFFHGTLSRMDPSRGWLFLSELSPYQGNLRMAPGQPVHLYGILENQCLHCQTDTLHSGEHDGEAFHVLAMPTTLDSEQKRAHIRARVGGGQGPSITLINEAGRRFRGQLVDISLGGLSAAFSPDTPIHDRELLTVVDLALPGILPIECGMQVRFASDHQQAGERMIGGRFFDLAPEDEQALLRSILIMEREKRRQAEPA